MNDTQLIFGTKSGKINVWNSKASLIEDAKNQNICTVQDWNIYAAKHHKAERFERARWCFEKL